MKKALPIVIILIVFIAIGIWVFSKQPTERKNRINHINTDVGVDDSLLLQFIENELITLSIDEPLKTIWLTQLNENTYQPLINYTQGVKATRIIEQVINRAHNHGFGSYFNQHADSLSKYSIKSDSLYQILLKKKKQKQQNYKRLAHLEIRSRLAGIAYKKALNFGIINPHDIYQSNYYVTIRKVDSTWYAKQFSSANFAETVSKAAPKHRYYEALQKAYVGFMTNEKRDWEELPQLPKRTIDIGDSYAGVPLLRKKFNLPPKSDSISNQEGDQLIFDEELANELTLYQQKHGLSSDGVLGASTLGLLNTSPKELQHQIEATLERFRWNTPINFSEILLVNIPEFALHVFYDNKLVQSHKVGVGINNDRMQTPEFIDTMKLVVVNPKWYVPRSITTREVLPKAQANPSYLAANNYSIYQGHTEIDPYSLDWSQYNSSNFPYRIVQGASAANSLGRIKFLFPNKYSIYLHDTPSKHVFKRDKRDVSHGCIRVQDPFKLGDFLMDNNPAYLEAKTQDNTRQFQVERPIQVFITYFTTWANAKGELQFRNDVYNRDGILIEHLQKVTHP